CERGPPGLSRDVAISGGSEFGSVTGDAGPGSARAERRGAHRTPRGCPDLGWRPGPPRRPLGLQDLPTHRVVALSSGYWKYPLISRIRWLKFVVYAVTSPLAPDGTIAAFATTVASVEFSVETTGM